MAETLIIQKMLITSRFLEFSKIDFSMILELQYNYYVTYNKISALVTFQKVQQDYNSQAPQITNLNNHLTWLHRGILGSVHFLFVRTIRI